MLDVIRGQTFSLDRHRLMGDEAAVFSARYNTLASRRQALREEYEH
jgi:hypothetical protein